MKIGVLSDTHMKAPDRVLNCILDDTFKDVSIILHAGDIVTASVLETLEEWDALAVCGNMDDFEIVDVIPQIRIITAETKRIGLIHGWGSKQGLQERILSKFEDDTPDLIIYGHSHVPFFGEVNGILMFNPGSASHGIHLDDCTVGILEIHESEINAKIIKIPQQH
ncbi:MAG: YfcE family phosphodiesterase [Deltaproteobacteria bacterium]|nr:YfcE family phosphodiesterase [Deltaproteobacteria bacterium]